MQDKIILGLLAFGDYSLYDLKKTMEQSTAMFYNTSIGSIHPALQKLAKLGYVEVHEEANGKRVKKVYRRTPAGAKAFQDWISEPVAIFKTKDESMLRLFYFGQIEGDVSNHIQLYIDEADEWINGLQAMLDAQDLTQIPDHLQKVAFFQLATIRYGLDIIKFSKQWYQDLLQQYQASGLTN
ncbi:PadR family transcriptional regulator [Salinibius halmophilus]|uniref:PadR family transcriptional regulator n=1 Tax=Salinibius halmophilus TaxID=1853216 RepID=UPI000E66A373|nr:helix-turn-helix transcriptional regulator [Salinibius halmophilus]